MTFEGEVSWTMTAKVRIKAANKNEAMALVRKHPAHYVVIADENPTQIKKNSTKVTLTQI